MSAPDVSSATQRFMDDMAAAGAPVSVDGARLLYEVIATNGPLAGQHVATGVSVSEVQSWPQVPPHWVHLQESIGFASTNMDTVDCPEGWCRHSREFGFVDASAPPAVMWLRHVRGLVSSASSLEA